MCSAFRADMACALAETAAATHMHAAGRCESEADATLPAAVRHRVLLPAGTYAVPSSDAFADQRNRVAAGPGVRIVLQPFHTHVLLLPRPLALMARPGCCSYRSCRT